MTPPQPSLEDVLRSKTRLKILKLLIQSDQLNISEIARRTRVNHASAIKHLRLLEDEGVLTHRMFSKRIRLYMFNGLSARAKAVQNLIRTYETSQGVHASNNHVKQ